MTTTEIPAIRKMLDLANGKRRQRTLSYDNVADCIHRCGELPGQYAFAVAGSVANAYKYPSTTTVCLAVRASNGTITLGVSVCDARSPTPGRAFTCVSPWRPNLDSHADKRLAWADAETTGFNRIRLIATGNDVVDLVANLCC